MARQIKKGPMQLRKEQQIKEAQPWIQCLNKNGKWGKPYQTTRFGHETDEQVIKRLSDLNPAYQFRMFTEE